MVALPLRPDLTPRDEVDDQALGDYVEAGGGLLLNQQAGQMITAQTLPFALARRFGTRILLEKTVSDPAASQQIGAWGSDHYTYTDRVSGPVAEGVRGVLYQSYVSMMSLGGVMPLLPQPPWQVVLAAGPNSRTEIFRLGLEEVDRYARAQGFAGDVPLAAVRECGHGPRGLLRHAVGRGLHPGDRLRRRSESARGLPHPGRRKVSQRSPDAVPQHVPLALGPCRSARGGPASPVPRWRPHLIPRPGSRSKA